MTLPSRLTERYLAGDRRALARAITLAESNHPASGELLAAARRSGRPAPVIGITGSPGSGKSTLVGAYIAHLRAQGLSVGVLAVDPSSPYTGGAILGDRIRMLRHHADAGVYVRSLATRGALGGLSARAVQALALMEGFGFDVVLLETVGVGQSEVDIAAVADHTVLVLTPDNGDSVQAFKAGVMEIADIMVVNKADLPGTDRLARDLSNAQGLGAHDEHTWMAPIVRTIASRDEGLQGLQDAVALHAAHLGPDGLRRRRAERARFELRLELQDRATALARGADRLIARIASGDLSAHDAALTLLPAARPVQPDDLIPALQTETP